MLCSRFKAPEGQYQLLSERTQGLIPFNYQRNTRLTHAQLFGGEEEGSWVIFNVADLVNVSRINATHGVGANRLTGALQGPIRAEACRSGSYGSSSVLSDSDPDTACPAHLLMLPSAHVLLLAGTGAQPPTGQLSLAHRVSHMP